MKKWSVLIVLAAIQMLLALDTMLMSVSISAITEDLQTNITAVQTVITVYALLIAALLITAGKLGDQMGLRLIIAVGLGLRILGGVTSGLAPSILIFAAGESVIEALGAVLIIPALVAMMANTYQGVERAKAFGVLSASTAVAVALGPILGGWLTTEFSWRVAFLGEAVLAAVLLFCVRFLPPSVNAPSKPGFDFVGVLLSASGMALVVLGFQRAAIWGWIENNDSPVTPLGLALTPFVVVIGAICLGVFAMTQRHRTARGLPVLVDPEMFTRRHLRPSLISAMAAQAVAVGLVFAILLYLQTVLGYTAFASGIALLPMAVLSFIAAVLWPKLSTKFSPRTITIFGMGSLAAAAAVLYWAVSPAISGNPFLLAGALLGLSLGLLTSQLSAVSQSAVTDAERSSVGGVHFTAHGLGTALGPAIIGTVVIAGLASAMGALVQDAPGLRAETQQLAAVEIERNLPFVSQGEATTAVSNLGISEPEAIEIVALYEQAQLSALENGALVAGIIAVAGAACAFGLPKLRSES
jgi:MFS family permease